MLMEHNVGIATQRVPGTNRPPARVVAAAVISFWCTLLAPSAGAGSSDFPVTPGVTIVIAVSNKAVCKQERPDEHIAQGDYEVIVKITAVDTKGISESAFIDGVDGSGKHNAGDHSAPCTPGRL